MKTLFLIVFGQIFLSMLLTILNKTYRIAGRTFGGGGGGGGKMGGGESSGSWTDFVPRPTPVTPTENSAEIQAAKEAEQQRRLKAVGMSSTNVTQGRLGDTSAATVAKPTLLGGS
jgi:hypothetical protein